MKSLLQKFDSFVKMNPTLSDEKVVRIKESIIETERIIDKEESYSEDLQNKELIHDYKIHRIFLINILKYYKIK